MKTINTIPPVPDLLKIPSWYQVPDEIKNLLLAAVESWDDTTISQEFILKAIQHPESTLEVLVSAYRYFFYKHNDAMARHLALKVMEKIRIQESLPDPWEDLKLILQDRMSEDSIRLYLSAYIALGIMLARWGAFQAAIEIATQIYSIDDRDVFGAGIILRILTEEA